MYTSLLCCFFYFPHGRWNQLTFFFLFFFLVTFIIFILFLISMLGFQGSIPLLTHSLLLLFQHWLSFNRNISWFHLSRWGSIALLCITIPLYASTACVNKSASLKEHFFLGKLYVSFEKVYNNMIGNIISFYRIFVLCNVDVWFRNYGKSCEVPPNLFGLIH